MIIVPGGLATELADKGKVRPSKIWLYPPALLSGRFADLQLAKYKGPNNEKDLNAPDVKIKTLRAFPILYHPLCAELSHDGWRPVMFPYDWRKDMEGDEISGALKTKIEDLRLVTARFTLSPTRRAVWSHNWRYNNCIRKEKTNWSGM